MADSKLRLQIITALDNAGLKATQQQLDNLEKQLTKVSNTGGSGFDGLSGKLQKMPGLVGDITGSFGKIGASIGYAYVAYQTFEKGVKAGNAIFEQFGDGAGYSLESIGNGFSSLGEKIKNSLTKFFTGVDAEEEIRKANQIAEENRQMELQAIEQASKKKMEIIKKEQQENQKVIDGIKKQTQAYLSQAQSLSGLKSSLGNARAIRIERQKFEEQFQYDLMGRSDIAEQIGLAYDVEIKRIKNEESVKQNDIEQRKADRDEKGTRRQLQQQKRISAELRGKMNDVSWEIESLRHKRRTSEVVAKIGKAKERLQMLKDEYDKSVGAETPLQTELENKIAKAQEIRQLGANLRMSNQMALDQAMLSYDNFQITNGNVGNFSFEESYIDSLNQLTNEMKYMEETARNTEKLADRFEEILRAKE